MIDVVWALAELEQVPIQDRKVVVVDVLRTSTTITCAIANGARAIVPAAQTEQALRVANSIGRGEVLLCGERGGLRIEGFDLGNSPSEFTAETVKGRTIVMATSNGTRALAAVAAARDVFVVGLVNLKAVARQLDCLEEEIVIVCAGRDSRIAAEDALGAGMLVEACVSKRAGRRRSKTAAVELGDGAVAALALAREYGSLTEGFLRGTAAGRALAEIGQSADIELCARRDSIPAVPVLREHQIVGLESPSRPRGEVGTRTS